MEPARQEGRAANSSTLVAAVWEQSASISVLLSTCTFSLLLYSLSLRRSYTKKMVSTLRTPGAADQLLIEEVRIHEVLYACPTKSNKDNQLRDVAWQEIADAVGKTGNGTALLRARCTLYMRGLRDKTNFFFSLFFMFVLVHHKNTNSGRGERTLEIYERQIRQGAR